VLEGAKVESNDTDGSKVGNGYTRCDATYDFAIFSGFVCLACGLVLTYFRFMRFQILLAQPTLLKCFRKSCTS